ncbi:TolC family protein [Runella slithyformis]|uniref:Outer membrane efflux protein n=1 Tax=Runella slithyformis (strain ATCC 29530 / DSM 19594 / LMG 11500 / NCIMB 11436 / LSU 4) TaxID=761193 RepID=A0A7U3ZRX1_RUNSL|nr:TolC family protein [Runella slithyformis]AEI52208.1 outer membrane efflux protein [Runella slithyformis DSM 19594]
MCKKTGTTIGRLVVLAAVFNIFSPWAVAQTTDTLTLSQCVEIALKNNQNIKNKRLDELINQTKIDETRADLYPQLKAKGSYQYYPSVPKSLVSSAILGGPPSEFTYSEFQVPQNIHFAADFSWQVYNPAILAALKISKISKVMSATATKEKLEAVVYDVSATFLNIQINELQADLTRSNIANLKKNVALTTQLFNQGLALRSDADNLNVSIVNLETVLSNQLNGLNQLYYLLKVYMGLPPSFVLCIEKYVQDDKIYIPALETDSSAYAKRSSYLSLKQTGDLLQLQRQSIKAGFLPTVNLIGSFGYSGLNTEFNFLKSYNSKWYPINLIQLNLEIPIFDGYKKRSQLLRNKFELDQNQNTLNYLRNTLQMEQMNAVSTYEKYVKDVEYQIKNLSLANKLYNQKQLEYRNSTASLNDIIAVENTLKSAQANYLNALIKLKLAELDLRKINGQLIKN